MTCDGHKGLSEVFMFSKDRQYGYRIRAGVLGFSFDILDRQKDCVEGPTFRVKMSARKYFKAFDEAYEELMFALGER